MTPEKAATAEDLFILVVKLPTAQQREFLDQRCGSDAELRAEVESLLRWHETAEAEAWEIPSTPGADAGPALAHIRARTLASKPMGPFELLEYLGDGATGIVYRAVDTRTQRTVALKIASPQTMMDEANRQRFEHAAEAAMTVSHPAIANVLETGIAEDIIYIALEYVEGRTLAAEMASGKLATAEALNVARQIAAALHAAHAQGIIHRDLKPANIMLDSAGSVKVLDFGLCHAFNGAKSIARTQTGVALGTIGYMAPEQARGESPTPKSDLFSFGAVLYEMLTGKPAFRSNTAVATLASVLNDQPVRAPGVPRWPLELALWCLEKDPGRRPKSAAQLLSEIARIENGRVSWPLRTRSFAIPKRWTIGTASAAAIAAIVLSLLLRHPDATQRQTSGLVRLTSDSGLTTTPALSADGKLIAYASDRSGEGHLDIWVQRADGREATRLTEDPADDYAPSFSPDSKTIAFRSEREGGGVYVVPTSGGSARLMAPDGRRPKFSPDGKWIAYWMGTDAGDTSSFYLSPGSGKMYITPSTGGPARELRADFAAAGYPIWTPDSKRLLFLGNSDRNQFQEKSLDWWVTPIDGGPVVKTGASAAFRKEGFPTVGQAPETWTPDGSGVLISATLADTRNIWRVPISPKTWTVSGAPQRLTFGTNPDVHPTIAGNRVVFASLNGNVDIWSLPLDANGGKPSGSVEKLTRDAVAHAYPNISADGTKLAFSSRRSGSRDVWVKDLRTGQETVVSKPPELAVNPNFSPSGGKLAYRVNEMERPGGYIVFLGRRRERLCDDCTDYGWSTDERRLLLVGTVTSRVSILDLASKLRRPFLNHSSYLLWNPRFSPDDRWVTFNATTPGRSRIFVAPVQNSGLIPESVWIPIAEGPWDDKPRWSPDGNIIYFVSERDRFRCIWAQHLDALKHPIGAAIAIFHAHEARLSLGNVGVGDLTISVARDKIVFNMSERAGNLWMANLGEGR